MGKQLLPKHSWSYGPDRFLFAPIPPPFKNPNPCSEELYDILTAKMKENPGGPATVWLHVLDAVQRGTISPMEAYDAITLGYVPEHLRVRESDYVYRLLS